MASADVMSSIKAVIGYMHCKKMRGMVFFMNTATGVVHQRQGGGEGGWGRRLGVPRTWCGTSNVSINQIINLQDKE